MKYCIFFLLFDIVWYNFLYHKTYNNSCKCIYVYIFFSPRDPGVNYLLDNRTQWKPYNLNL